MVPPGTLRHRRADPPAARQPVPQLVTQAQAREAVTGAGLATSDRV